MIDELRKLWGKWGPFLAAIATTLLALLGATYYVSQKIAALEGIQGATSDLRSSFGDQDTTLDGIERALEARRLSSEQLADQLNEVGRRVEGVGQKVDRLSELTAAGGERVATLKAEQARLERFQDDSREKLNEILDRLARLEARQELLEALQSAEFGGATIESTDDTIKVYMPDEGERFRRDAKELLESGRSIHIATKVWVSSGYCVDGDGGCLEISFSGPPGDNGLQDDYRISLHVPEDGESPDSYTARRASLPRYGEPSSSCPSLRVAAFIGEKLESESRSRGRGTSQRVEERASRLDQW